MSQSFTALVFLLLVHFGASSACNAAPQSGAPAENPSASQRIDSRTLKKPAGLPDAWRADFVKEPVFNSKMLTIEAGTGNARTVILVHGLGQDGHRVWNGLIPALAKNYHVLTFDLPGFGHSEKPAGQYSPENYGRLLKWLDARYAKSPAVVIGHSMGSGVALHYAAQNPERVAKVILVDAAGVLEKTAFVKSSAQLPVNEDLLPAFLSQWVNQINNLVAQAIEWANINPDPIEMLRMTEAGWRALLSDRPNTNAALGLITHDFSRDIDGFPHETVLIWGGRDSIAPLRIGQLLNGRLPKSRLHVIAGAAHVPMRSHSVRFNALIDRALHGEFEADSPLPPQTASDAVLRCNNESGTRYSGHYRRIVINRCLGVALNEVTAESMELTDSIVTLTNVRIHSGGTAVTAVNSGLTATSAEISGTIAIRADASRLDLAGVTLSGRRAAVRVEGESFLIASVSDVIIGRQRCHIHGTYRMANQVLKSSLPDQCQSNNRVTFLPRPDR